MMTKDGEIREGHTPPDPRSDADDGGEQKSSQDKRLRRVTGGLDADMAEAARSRLRYLNLCCRPE